MSTGLGESQERCHIRRPARAELPTADPARPAPHGVRSPLGRRPARWIVGWDPEDGACWQAGGRRIAWRNLAASVLSEHVGFSVWTMWSVLVLFMSPEIGFTFTPADKFLLVAVPTLVGAGLRLPYGYWVTRYGPRKWTVFASAVLLPPAIAAWYFVQQPGTPLWVFLLIGAAAGVGGGNFASSMTTAAMLFPQRQHGLVLGLNAGAGNLGVAAIQVVGLLVIATAGDAHPSYVVAVYLPLIVLATLLAAGLMDTVTPARPARPALWAACRHPHTWWICLLYIGTFGSFIGYAFAFGLVLQYQFGATALQAASYTFLGPLLGSLARPLGGWLADRFDAAAVTFAAYLGMAAGTMGLLVASVQGSLSHFITSFVVVFVLSGMGNGATYKMIHVTFARQAEQAVTTGSAAGPEFARAYRLSMAVIGIAGAVGALGGVAINLIFRATYAAGSGGQGAFVAFLVGYAACLVVTWLVYLRPAGGSAHPPALRLSRREHRGAA